MQVCYRCKSTKRLNQFNWKNKKHGVRQPYCRECARVYRRTWYLNHRQEQIDRAAEVRKRTLKETKRFLHQYLKTHPCISCGETDPILLEFDHLNGKRKRKDISVLRSTGYSVKVIKKEIEKCQVLCANCHRKKTAKDQSWSKYKFS